MATKSCFLTIGQPTSVAGSRRRRKPDKAIINDAMLGSPLVEKIIFPFFSNYQKSLVPRMAALPASSVTCDANTSKADEKVSAI